jgi:hypothetical protein
MAVVLILANGERRTLVTGDNVDDERALVQIQDRHGPYQNGWARTLGGPNTSALINLDHVVEAIVESD